MSKGPGKIEKRVADLFAATRDNALSVDDIARHAFGLAAGVKPTRTQRLSATRATHRLLRRVREADDLRGKLFAQAHETTANALGRIRRVGVSDPGYDAVHDKDAAYLKARELSEYVNRIGVWPRFVRVAGQDRMRVEPDYWTAAKVKGRAYFYPPDAPVQVWAVSFDRSGVNWFEAEVIKITERNVIVRYAGEKARLDRDKLWRWWAFWRGVCFVSSRTGRIANELDELWQKRYGHHTGGPTVMRMPIGQAMALLHLEADYTREDVIAAFRREAKKAHPDAGGTAEMFRVLVEARDRLLASLGTKAAPPKMPQYAPKGAHVIYRTSRGGHHRLGSAMRRLS